jgi:hypothetical protein
MSAKPKKELSRQRIYQMAHEEAGICRLCKRRAVAGKLLCKEHREDSIRRNREAVRRRKGLPLDTPLMHGDRRTKSKTGAPIV